MGIAALHPSYAKKIPPPDGLDLVWSPLSIPIGQNIFAFMPTQITSISDPVSSHHKGRIAIVTDAGRDAVDADVLLTSGTEADGEVVWS
jgi:hypothetical protein